MMLRRPRGGKMGWSIIGARASRSPWTMLVPCPLLKMRAGRPRSDYAVVLACVLTLNMARLAVTLAILLCAVSPGFCGTPKQDAAVEGLNQVICGPRCVQFVLKHYGHEESLTSLVREMQWPDQLKGSSVQQVEKALESRGVHVRSIQLSNVGSFWPKCPAIVHLLEEDSEGDKGVEGHFVVVMPESDANDAVVWDGLWSTRREPWAKFSRKMTGVVVLTSDGPIDDVDAAVQLRAGRSAWTVCLWAVLALGAIILIPMGPCLLRGFAKGSKLLLGLRKSSSSPPRAG
jgi:hypothetical protein